MMSLTKSRIFLWALLCFIAGVGARSFVAIPLAPLFVGAIGTAVWLGVSVIGQKRGAWIPALFLLAFFAGAIRFAYAEVARPDVSMFYEKKITMLGIVDEEPERRATNQRIAVYIKERDTGGVRPSSDFRVLATLRPYPAYAIGDELIIEGILQAPRQDDDFDEVSYLKRRDITATVFYPAVERVAQEKGNRLALYLSKIKHAFENNIDAILPEPHAAFLKGLLLGDRASLPPSLVEDFRATGTSHMVALSGYNITLVGSALSRVLLILTVPFLAAFWVAVAAIALFVLMTGAAASVVRAGIMGILLLVAQKEGRAYRMTPALALAAAVMVAYHPYVLAFDAGFQLSFFATVGLIYLAPQVERWMDDFLHWARGSNAARAVKKYESKEGGLGVRRILVETLAAQIAVLPLLILLFGRVSVISPLANVAVLLATPYAMGIGFFAAILAFVSVALGRIAGGVAWVILEYQLRAVALLAKVPFAGMTLGNAGLIIVMVIYAWIGFMLWKRSKNMRRRFS
ncbi:MAG: ComEC/Rec2 family competence protein [Candidatus Sungiibacteriota bacterium]